MNTKNNSRSQASRQALRKALLALLEKQELSEITAAQLCREAGVNRSTFYAHYGNMWDVLAELEEEMDNALLSQFQWVRDTQDAMLDKRSFLIITKQIASYPAFFRARLNNPSVRNGRFKLGMDWLMEQVVLPYAKSRSDTPLLPYYMEFFRAGFFQVLGLWIDGNCKESAEDIATLLHEMTIQRFLNT